MIIRALREFFLGCPLFLKKDINVNFLGHNEGNCSVEPLGTLSVVKTYCDGKRILSQDFCMGIRCVFDANTRMNLNEAEFLEKVALWIHQQNLIGNMPMLSGDYTSVGIRVTKMPYLYESSIQGAKMQLEFTLLYRED